MSIALILQLLLPTLLNLLGTEGVISPSLSSLVTKLASAIPTLIASLISGSGVTNDILAVLRAVQTEVNALKASSTLLTLNQANEINALDKGIADAIAAYQASTVATDPSTLMPLPETL